MALLPNISLYDTEAQQLVQAFTQNFLRRGFSLDQAYQLLTLIKQASLITYAQAFTMLGPFLLACIL